MYFSFGWFSGNLTLKEVLCLNLIVVKLIHRPFTFCSLIHWKSGIEGERILELSHDKTHSSAVCFSFLWNVEHVTFKEIVYLNLVILRLIYQPFGFDFQSQWKSRIGGDTIEERNNRKTYSWDIYVSVFWFIQKLDIVTDTIFELSDRKTYSCTVSFSVFWFIENLTLKEIHYLNLVIVRLIHQPFIFSLMIHWKSDIERDSILELSYLKNYLSAVCFRFSESPEIQHSNR